MNNAPQRLKITEPGWQNFTGHFGGVEFQGSVSVDVVDNSTATHLGSIIRIEKVDTKTRVGASEEIVTSYFTKADVVPELPRGNVADHSVAPTPHPTIVVTREQLEAIADQHGISGLRELADQLGVKGTSIVKLIDGILSAKAQ